MAAPPQAPPPTFSPQQIDSIVASYALYPDPLLAVVLSAATFSSEIPEAASWARQHSYLTGDALARAITEDNLPWDPSVIALLPFPAVLDRMAGDMSTTQALGDAVLADRASVMDAIQDARQKAMYYGYLRTGPFYKVVTPGPGDIEILPVDPTSIFVPFYDPDIVFFRPRPGFFVGGAIAFGPRVVITASFAPWGWGTIRLGWRTHEIFLNNRPWARIWANRLTYIHPWTLPPRPGLDMPRTERHELRTWHAPPLIEPGRGR
jgi:hypothetical protein